MSPGSTAKPLKNTLLSEGEFENSWNVMFILGNGVLGPLSKEESLIFTVTLRAT